MMQRFKSVATFEQTKKPAPTRAQARENILFAHIEYTIIQHVFIYYLYKEYRKG